MGSWWQRVVRGLAKFVHRMKSVGQGDRGRQRGPTGDGHGGTGGASRPGRPSHDAGQLIAALGHPNPDVRAGAARQLGALGAGAAAVDSEDSPDSPGLGASGSGASGSGATRVGKAPPSGPSPEAVAAAQPIVTALLQAMADADASVRSSAALSLGEWGVAAAGAVPALINALAEEDDDVRSSVGIALQDIGRAARPPLEEALSAPDPRIRAEAEAILAMMDPARPEP